MRSRSGPAAGGPAGDGTCDDPLAAAEPIAVEFDGDVHVVWSVAGETALGDASTRGAAVVWDDRAGGFAHSCVDADRTTAPATTAPATPAPTRR